MDNINERSKMMNKYIDASAVKINYRGGFYDDYVVDYDSFMNAPSIDIVHCGECKYWHKNRKNGDDIPIYDACYDFTADDFCSYGEREDK